MPLEAPPPELMQSGWGAWIRDFLWRVVQSEIPEGVSWTSWFRDPYENRRVGGDPWSNHLLGLGLDADHYDLGALYRWESRLERQGLGAVVELGSQENWPYNPETSNPSHLHMQRLSVGVLERYATTGQWTQRV